MKFIKRIINKLFPAEEYEYHHCDCCEVQDAEQIKVNGSCKCREHDSEILPQCDTCGIHSYSWVVFRSENKTCCGVMIECFNCNTRRRSKGK